MGLGNPISFLNYLAGKREGQRSEVRGQTVDVKDSTVNLNIKSQTVADGWGGMPSDWGQRGGFGKPSSLQRHDERFHGGHYDGKGTCQFRKEREKDDRYDLFSYLSRGLSHSYGQSHWGSTRQESDRPKRQRGAVMPLGTPSDVGPGRVTALSSHDFSLALQRFPKADRIFALSDIHDADHGDIDSSAAGTVIMAGDFSQDGATSESRRIDMAAAVESGKKWLTEKFFPKCEKESDRRFVLIAGNHDHFLAAPEMADVEWPENVDYLCDSEAIVNGLRVYGTPWCSERKGNARIYTQPLQFAQKPFEVDDETLAEKYAKIPEGLDVLVVHQTPKADGYDGDLSYASGQEVHSGSEELTKAILRAKPKLVICGHLHDGDHRPFRIGDSVVVNTAYVKGRAEPGYTAQEIGIERGDAEQGGNGFVLDGEDTHEVRERKKVESRWRK